ncbi:MAG: allantoate amidohydrolase [Pseudomonadota bacterium]
MQFGPRIMARVVELAAVTDTPGILCRRYLTPEHAAANDLAATWMRAAGMNTRIDAAGNLIGRYEGETPGLPALMVGSHLDTVRNAGAYDGMLGVLTAIECVDALHRAGRRLPYAIEVVGFGDEEGVRFQATLLGSTAVAGTFDRTLLERVGEDGIAMADAMRGFGLDPNRLGEAARSPDDVIGYVEVHIEQGPVLESTALPVGIVTAIAGASRFNVSVTGLAGHAGTVPMPERRDALTGAAEMILAVEQICAEAGIVGTVGQASVEPGAVNVISGATRFSLDVRAAEDGDRRSALKTIRSTFECIAARRRLSVSLDETHDAAASPCSARLADELADAVARAGIVPHRLPSGAGHDAMAMAALTDTAMLFVRCEGGISHHPDENITVGDADVATRVLLDFLVHHMPRTHNQRAGAT